MENSFIKVDKPQFDYDTLELTGLPASFFKENRER